VDGVILSSGPIVDTVWYKETWPAYNETTATLAGNDLGTWTLTGGTLATGTPDDHYEVDLARLPSGLKAVRWVGASAVSYLTSPTVDLSDFRTNEKITTVNQTGSLADRSVSDSRIYLTVLLAAQSMDSNAEYMEVQLSNDNGVTFHEHQAFVWQDNDADNDDITDTTWRKVVIDISEFVYKPSFSFSDGFKIRFMGTGTGTGDSYGVSNIYIHDAPIPNKLKAKTLKLGDASLSNSGDLDYDEFLEIVSAANTFKGLVLNETASVRDNYVGVQGADSLVLAADELNAGNNSRIDFRIDGKDRMKLYTSTDAGASEAHLQLIGHTTPTDRSNWRISAHDNATKGYFAISDYSGGSWSENFTVNHSGKTEIIGQDDQDNFIVQANQTQFAIHQDDTDGEVSLRAQDGSGSNNAKYMTFFTPSSGSAAEERLRIKSTGEVGIGTISPQARLEVRTDVAGDLGGEIRISNYSENSPNSTVALRLQPNINHTRWASIEGHQDPDGQTRVNLLFKTAFGGTPVERMRLTCDGNVGIGTDDPEQRLHVQKADNIETARFERTGAGDRCGIGFVTAGTTSTVNIGSRSDAFTVELASSEKFRVSSNGNVGIGTDGPTSKLHVVGDITTTDGNLYLNGGTMSIGDNGAYEGVYWESEKHGITYNDGMGNFNIRVGNNGLTDEKCTEAGFIFQDEWSQTSGWRQFNISSASIAVGTTPSWRTQIEYDSDAVYLRYQGSAKLYTTTAGVTVNGTVTPTSDIRLKENIQDIESPLDKVNSLRGVKFDWKSNGETDYGFIAQEVEQVIPEIVRTETLTENINKVHEETEVKTLSYQAIIGVLVEAVKELTSEVEALKSQISGS